MKVSDPPRGLIVDLITPLNKNGDIDGRGLGQLLDRVLPSVQGVLLASPYMGEGKDLGPSQLEEILEKSLVVVRGQVPILVWISRNGEEQTKETLLLLKKRLETRKYVGPVFWVDAPLFYHSNRGLPFHYQNLSSMTKEPFILHNDPELIKQLAAPLKRANIRTAILKELALTDAIRGLIFQGSLDRSHNYQKAVRQRSKFRIYDGGESRFLKHPSLSGLISAGANLAPMTWRKITASSLGLDGNGNEYPDRLQQIWEWGSYLQALKDLYKGAAVPLVKQVLSDMGIIDSPACSHKTEEDIGEKVGRLKTLMKQHGDYPL
jgi:dihydrodipicolinate synthase/N-acetylneuraminate lyase